MNPSLKTKIKGRLRQICIQFYNRTIKQVRSAIDYSTFTFPLVLYPLILALEVMGLGPSLNTRLKERLKQRRVNFITHSLTSFLPCLLFQSGFIYTVSLFG